MPEFLLECHVSRTDGGAVARGEERARLAAAELTLAGTRVRFDRSINVPGDEICCDGEVRKPPMLQAALNLRANHRPPVGRVRPG